MCNNRKYLTPLSHAVAKHTKMKPRADFDKIFDRKGKLIGVLNYNFMIPVEEAQIYKVNLKPDSVSIFFFMQQMEKCCTLIRRKPLPYTILEADAKEVGNEY